MTTEATDTPKTAAAVGAQVDRPVRPLPVVAWLASTPDGKYALTLTEKGALKLAGESADDVVPLTLKEAAEAEIERLRAVLLWISENGPDDAYELRHAARCALEA